MTNRPKQIGTATETALVRYFRARGWPRADRLALRGSGDIGDIGLDPRLCIEVKGGKAAETASDTQVTWWLVEAQREAEAKGAALPILIMKRKGVGAANCGRWWAVMTSENYDALRLADEEPVQNGMAAIRFTVDHLIETLIAAGYREED